TTCHSYMYIFFTSKRRHTTSTRDCSSDVCSSDLALADEFLRLVELNVLLEPRHVERCVARDAEVRSVVEDPGLDPARLGRGGRRSEERRVGKDCCSGQLRWVR